MSGAETKTEVFTVTDVGEAEKDTRMNKTRSIFEQYVQPCLAELFGTGLFVFVGCASVVGNTGTAGIIQPAVAHGMALAVMIQIFGQISGGHFNPVVSLIAYLCGGMELLLLGPYVVAQMLGGMLGAGLTMGVFPVNMSDASLGGAFDVTNKDLAGATLAEVILTALLTLVVCMAAINGQTRTPLAPLCIGLTVTANILAGGAVSGACMNPVRAFGPAVVYSHWDHHWIYWVGPICGTLCTASLIRLLFGDYKTRVVFK